MKKYLLSLITFSLLLCEASFTGGGMVFAFDNGDYTYTIISSSAPRTVSIAAKSGVTLSGSITLPSSVTYSSNSYSVVAITENGFKAKTAITSVTIPNTVTTINNSAFYGCTGITSISIPSGVTSIGQYAFYNCSNITSVTIPLSVTSFGSSAFYGCSKITTVKYASLATNWANINFANSYANPIYYAKRLNCSNSANPTTSMTGLGSATVHKIKQYAFYNDTAITSLTFNASVDSIAANAFNGCKGIKSITITANMKNIAPTAFSSCTNLATITWNATNYTAPTGYSTSPFYNPNTYIKTFKFGASVTNIPAYVCYGMTNLEAITLPTNTATIGQNAFQNCSKIAELEVPLSVTSIGAEAFKGCTGLTKILARPVTPPTASANTFTSVSTTIPITVTSLAISTAYSGATGWNGFTNYVTTRSGSCGESANWELDYAAGTLTITGSGATTDFGSNSDVPWIQDTSFIHTASVANAITRLGNRTFYGCERLTKISISSSQLTSIGQYAMYKCTRLVGFGSSATQINIPKDVATIDNYAFQYCSSATKVYFMSTSVLTTIGSNAFQYMSNLNDVAIYNCANLTTINGNAFANCTSLASITFPASITTIGSSAFANCTALTPEDGSVNFKGTVDQWASIAFSGQASNPALYTKALKINGSLLTSCTISVPVKQYAFYNNEALTSVAFTEGCTSIGGNAFVNCTNLAGTIVIPSTLTELGTWAFKNCSSLTGVDMLHADALTTIGGSAFWETNLAGELYIPAGVTSVGGSAFRDITGITAIYASPTTAPSSINDYTFNTTAKTIPFYVLTPDALTSYSGASYWNAFTNMKVGGYCGATGNETGVKWEFNTTSGLLTISGSGAMKDYANSSSNRSPWYSFASSVTSIKICDGVTHLGKYAFNNCSNATEVWMTTTVTECGASAFLGCSSLNNVKYGKTSTPTLSYATGWAQIDFGNYSANPLSFAHTLQVYKATSTMPAWGTVIGFENRNIDQIKKYAFYGCTSLTSAVIPSNVETIEESAFYGCTNLATLTLPDALTTIGKEAFKNCSTLTSITIPENVTTMTCHNGSTTYSIFGGCANLTTIEWNARNCASDYIKVGTGSGYNYGTPFSGIYSQITSITFGENVERIPNYLCYHMDHLTSVTIPASVTNIGTEAFDACTNLDSVICEGATPPTLGSGAFSSPSTKKLYLPHDVAAKAAYRAASGWSSFTEANTFPKIVQFDLNGQTGDAIDPQFFDNITSKASAPSNPADVNYHSFSGWYQEAECENAFNFEGAITQDTILYAKWTIYNYQVTFDMQGHGSSIAAQTIDHNGLVSEPSAPSETGYTFGGWYKEAGCANSWNFSEDHITAATILYAKWTINSYDVTFDLQGHGSAIAAQTIDYNGLVSKPSDPEAANYTFGGWFKEPDCSNEWNFSEDYVTDDLTLYAKWTLNGLALDEENENNDDLITAYNGLTTNVTMTRSLTNAQYNTFCLPFALSNAQLEYIFGADYDLEEFVGSSLDGDQLNLTFERKYALEAGKPYLLQPTNSVTNPSFADVTIAATLPADQESDDYISFHGTFSPTELEGGNRNLLFLGADNELFWPESTGNIKGFRAYFVVKGSAAKAAKRARIVKKEDTATGIETITNDQSPITNKIIKDNQLLILRDGKTYNAQGMRVE